MEVPSTQNASNLNDIAQDLRRVKPHGKPSANKRYKSCNTPESQWTAPCSDDHSSVPLDNQMAEVRLHTARGKDQRSLKTSPSVSTGDDEACALMRSCSSFGERVQQGSELPTSPQLAARFRHERRTDLGGTHSSQDPGTFSARLVSGGMADSLPNFGNTSEDIEEALRLLAEHVDQRQSRIEPLSWSDDIFDDTAPTEVVPEWLDVTQPSEVEEPKNETDSFQTFSISTPTRQQRFSSVLSPISRNRSKSAVKDVTSSETEFNLSGIEYNDSDLDASLIDLTTSEQAQPATPRRFPWKQSPPKLRWLSPKSIPATFSNRLPPTPEGKQSLDLLGVEGNLLRARTSMDENATRAGIRAYR